MRNNRLDRTFIDWGPRLYEMFAPLAASCFVSVTLCAVGETLKSLLSEST